MQLEPLMDALLKSRGQEMRLVPGERIYVLKNGQRQDVGREPLTPANVIKIASEALSGVELVQLSTQEHSKERSHSNEDFRLNFSQPNGAVHIVITRLSAPAVETTPPPATVTTPPRAASASPPPASKNAKDSMSNTSLSVNLSTDTTAIDEFLRFMCEKDASDIHLSSDAHPILRVHGEIQFFEDRDKLQPEVVANLAHSIMTPQARQNFEEKRDADCAYEIEGLSRFRVNVFEDRKGVGIVVRTIPVEILTAEQLNLPQAVLDLCFLSKGLVLVTGPTGSGKSTTMAAMIDHINKHRNDHIITIEDPIEFVHENQGCLINQRQVGNHTTSFKSSLRAALREDPDIVLVGELRDLETIAIAIETAETGHLVFGTLHTTTAVSTVDRIIDQFPPDQQSQIRVMLADALKGVIAQVLCKKIEGGRAAALEILLGTPALSSLIREGKTFQIPSIMQTAKRQGMLTMNDSLVALVKDKQIDAKEAWIKAVDKTGLLGLFRNQNIPHDFAKEAK